jgi:small GTP-binding protein
MPHSEAQANALKLVVVGDGAVGKTCLLVVYAKGSFPTEYVPTVFENYKCKVTVSSVEYNIQLWDTTGQEELEAVRTLSYPNTNVFILCYSVADRTSYDNVKNKWVVEIKQHVKDAAFLLVGTKSDLRATADSPLTAEDGRALQAQIGALDFLECSTMKCDGIKDVFDRAIEGTTLKQFRRQGPR